MSEFSGITSTGKRKEVEQTFFQVRLNAALAFRAAATWLRARAADTKTPPLRNGLTVVCVVLTQTSPNWVGGYTRKSPQIIPVPWYCSTDAFHTFTQLDHVSLLRCRFGRLIVCHETSSCVTPKVSALKHVTDVDTLGYFGHRLSRTRVRSSVRREPLRKQSTTLVFFVCRGRVEGGCGFQGLLAQ